MNFISDFANDLKPARKFKGKSLLDLLDEYIVIDIETSGLDPSCDEIIEIGAIKISNNEEIESFNTLIKPLEKISRTITSITGITNEILADAPTIHEVLPLFSKFIGNKILLGHNVNFDINFLYDNMLVVLDEPLSNNFIDTLRISRRVFKDFPDHKLNTLINRFNIGENTKHRALSDCCDTYRCYEYMKNYIIKNNKVISECSYTKEINKKVLNKYKTDFTDETKTLQMLQGILLGIICDDILSESEVISLKNWLDNNKNLAGNYPFDRVNTVIENALNDGILEQCELDELLCLFKQFTNPTGFLKDCKKRIDFAGKTVCLTGEFDSGTKRDVEIILSGLGAKCSKTVISNTSYLIVGGQGSVNWKCGNYGGKIKKALELQEKGNTIEIISEVEFCDSINTEGEINE